MGAPLPQNSSATADGRVGVGYRPHLDGLRAVAVYLVLLFHAGADRFSGGFVGVDVFFVLSGYLVTQLLLRDLVSRGSIRFGRFYSRRMRRLLPASLATLLITGVVYSAIASKAEVASSVNAFKAAFLYVANWFFIRRSTGYFATDVNTLPVVHFWSLAVEEQFYLLWPILLGTLFAVARRFGHNAWRFMQVIVAAGALCSMLAALSLASHHLDRAYYGTDTRAYELLAGAFIALTPGIVQRARGRRFVGLVAGIACAAVVILATSFVHVNAVQRGVATTIAAVTLIVCIEAASAGPVNRILSSSPAVYLGKISYGTYLWHWPVLVVAFSVTNQSISPISAFGIAALAGTGIASLSYQILEHPIREQRLLDRMSPAVIATGLVVGIVSALVIVPAILDSGRQSGGAASAAPQPGLTPTPALDFDKAKTDLGGELKGVKFLPHWNCEGMDVSACTIVKGSGVHILVVGDSHAWAMFPTFAKIAQEKGLSLSTDVTGGCPWQRRVFDANPVPSDPSRAKRCLDYKKDLYGRVIPQLKPDLIVVIDNDYNTRRPGTIYDADDKPIDVRGESERLSRIKTETQRSLTEMEKSAKKILIVEPLPTAPVKNDPFLCLTRSKYLENCQFTAPTSSLPLKKMYRGLADNKRVYVADFDKLVCPALPVCDPVVNGIIVRWDIQHLTPRFALSIAKPITAYLQDLRLIAHS